MQRVLLHRGDDVRAVRADGDAGVAALPFQDAGLVLLGGHEPERGAVVVAGRHPLALGVEGDAADGGRVRQDLQRRAVRVVQVDRLAHGGGAHAALVRRDVLDPARAHRPRDLLDGGVGGDAHQPAVVAAGKEAAARIGAEGEAGAAVMRRRGCPLPRGRRRPRHADRAVAEAEAADAGPPAVPGGGDHPSAEVARDSAAGEQKVVADDVVRHGLILVERAIPTARRAANSSIVGTAAARRELAHPEAPTSRPASPAHPRPAHARGIRRQPAPGRRPNPRCRDRSGCRTPSRPASGAACAPIAAAYRAVLRDRRPPAESRRSAAPPPRPRRCRRRRRCRRKAKRCSWISTKWLGAHRSGFSTRSHSPPPKTSCPSPWDE